MNRPPGLPRPPEPPAGGPSVWLAGQRALARQFAEGGYLPGTADDAAAVPPAVAEYAVAVYSRPGEVVYDPDCGAGTVLVEALRAGRHAVGTTRDEWWWALARANVTAAKAVGAATDGTVLDTCPRRSGGLDGGVDLVLTALREPRTDQCPDPGGHRRAGPAGGRPPGDLAGLAVALLRPGGRLVVVVRPRYGHDGRLADDAGVVLAAGRGAGLVPAERRVALLAELRGRRLLVRAGLAERRAAAARSRATGKPATLTAHAEVLVLRAPQRAEDGAFHLDRPRHRPARAARGTCPRGLAPRGTGAIAPALPPWEFPTRNDGRREDRDAGGRAA